MLKDDPIREDKILAIKLLFLSWLIGLVSVMFAPVYLGGLWNVALVVGGITGLGVIAIAIKMIRWTEDTSDTETQKYE